MTYGCYLKLHEKLVFAIHPLAPRLKQPLPKARVLHARVTEPARVETPKTVKPMAVDFEKVVDLWDDVASYLAKEFAR